MDQKNSTPCEQRRRRSDSDLAAAKHSTGFRSHMTSITTVSRIVCCCSNHERPGFNAVIRRRRSQAQLILTSRLLVQIRFRQRVVLSASPNISRVPLALARIEHCFSYLRHSPQKPIAPATHEMFGLASTCDFTAQDGLDDNIKRGTDGASQIPYASSFYARDHGVCKS